MNAEIVAIGSELLLGETIDTNSAYLARQLTELGISLFRKTVIGDNEVRIAGAISDALGRADLVICTGGLGPTADDVTREAVARVVGRPLVFHQYLLDQIEARFHSFGRTMSPSNRRQAYVPEGARVIENPHGTAPSFIVEDGARAIVSLPGVPSEMRFLWEHAVVPYLRDERGETSVILVRTLYATGLSESVVGEMLEDLMLQANPTLGISAKRGQFELRIGTRASSRAEAEALAEEAAAIIRARLGGYLVGEEALGPLVARLLRDHELTLALYEGATSAPVHRALALAGALSALRGAIIHPLDRPADADAVQELARVGAHNAQDRWRAQLAIGAQQASAPDDDGFTAVGVVLLGPHGERTWMRRFDLSLDENWETIGTVALDGLRTYLLAEE